MDQDVVHHLVGNRGQRGLAVTGLPQVPHLLQKFAATEPSMEVRVHRHVQVRRDGEATGGANHVGVLRRTHEDPRHDLTLLAPGGTMNDRGHLGHVGG